MTHISQLRRSSAIEQIASDGWIATVEWLVEVDSTNNYLKRELAEGTTFSWPRLVVADRQSGGRGRGQNTWWSPEGCLMFSLAWRPIQPSPVDDSDVYSHMGQLPLVVGISIASALRPLIADEHAIKVKWPNDLYVGNRKLGGILIEGVHHGTEAYWIIGIGINVCVDIAKGPEPIRSNATSLQRECRPDALDSLCVESVLVAVIHKLEETLERWQTQKVLIETEWPAYCLLTGRTVEIQHANQVIEGVCLGIDHRGALLIRDRLGNRHAILSGVVQSW